MLVKTFLEENATQLTYYGLTRLNEHLRIGQAAVLFRNDHFATILKLKKGIVCLLTDQGYKGVSAV